METRGSSCHHSSSKELRAIGPVGGYSGPFEFENEISLSVILHYKEPE